MNFLEERIQKDGVVKEGNVLKVDSFLNHQMDIELFEKMGEEWKRRFNGKRDAFGLCIGGLRRRYDYHFSLQEQYSPLPECIAIGRKHHHP